MPASTQYNYDIFISYRHHDDRSGWVSEFVRNLKAELAATIKRPVSIYFDSNPEDGLLENHHVQKSLERKLDSLIFIPVLSQTYCDESSFAWNKEFCAFVAQARTKKRMFITLDSGNVAMRVIPIRLHEIDPRDVKKIETELRAPLRCIDFIFSERGLIRPLLPMDAREENSKMTVYRDQLLKLAHAIKEILITSEKLQLEKRDPAFSLNKKHALTFLIASILVMAGLLVNQYFFRSQSVAENHSIAVLPFVDLSPNHDQEYFGQGVADNIISSLVNLRKLRVIGRTSSFQFGGTGLDLKEVGRRLGVSHVLEGSVIKNGSKIRVTAHLVSVDDQSELWSERFEGEATDILQIQDEISRAIATKMKASFSPSSSAGRASEIKNLEAFENLLKGNQALGPLTAERARAFFLKSIAIDSSNVESYYGLAMCDFFQGDRQALKRSIRKVEELNPGSAASHELQFLDAAYARWDWDAAETHYKEYLELTGIPLVAHALLRADAGHVDDGIRELEERLANDPLDKDAVRILGWLYCRAGKIPEAVTFTRKSLEIDPYYAHGYRTLAKILIVARKYDEALEAVRTVEKLDSTVETRMVRIWALTGSGRMKEAEELYHTTEVQTLDDVSRAKIEFMLRNYVSGFKLLDQLVGEHAYDLLSIRDNPEFAFIPNDHRRAAILRKIPFPE